MRHARDRGAAAVEAALVLPLLLLLIFGIIDFGRMLNTQLTVTEAAREAARVSSFGHPMSEVRERAQRVAPGADVDRDFDDRCPPVPEPTADTTVTVSVEFEFITPVAVLAGIVDRSPTISARGVMPCHG